ncbi:MAG: hypothetical protein N3J91_09455 [Verrucomicrobiae bacterium]|nr:hypothetical protein [Verrucomicrobiae bacterium]
MDAQEIVALSLVALTAAGFAWRWWRRRQRGVQGLPCSDCCGGGGGRPARLRLRATKDGPVAIGLKPPAP